MVELLEAVHLLLAFDLFVVVVGVDPRWLLHSLREKFSAFQNGADKPSSEQLEWVTTPQDYLEKIFQIPFSLRRMEPAGFSALMRRLLHETAAQTVEVPAPAQPVEVSAPDTTIGQSEVSQQTLNKCSIATGDREHRTNRFSLDGGSASDESSIE